MIAVWETDQLNHILGSLNLTDKKLFSRVSDELFLVLIIQILGRHMLGTILARTIPTPTAELE